MQNLSIPILKKRGKSIINRCKLADRVYFLNSLIFRHYIQYRRLNFNSNIDYIDSFVFNFDNDKKESHDKQPGPHYISYELALMYKKS